MKSNHHSSRYKMSPSDVEAILVALSLIDTLPGIAPAQRMINSALCKSATDKLNSHQNNFTANELRVIAAATLCATEYLTGNLPDISLDEATVSILKKHFISYARLNAYFQPQLEALDNQAQ